MEKNCSAARITLISFTLISIIVGMSISSYMLSRFMLKIQKTTEKSITVKGVAEKEIISDLASFVCSVSVKSTEKAAGYNKLTNAVNMLNKKLELDGFPESVRFDKSIGCSERFKTTKTTANGKTVEKEEFVYYELTYTVTIRTKDMEKVENNVLKLHSLAQNGVDISVSNPEYFISNPEQYKLELVNQACASAAERAKIAANQSGSSLGALIKARQGVIQITAPADNATSDYGTYNTSSLRKVIRMVMTMEFALK